MEPQPTANPPASPGASQGEPTPSLPNPNEARLPQPEEMLLTPKSQSKKPKLIYIVAGILVIIIMATGMFICTQSFFKKTTPKPSPIAKKTTPIATPTIDETVNWKTYANRKCAYEIKYPTDWKLLPEPEDAIYGAAVIYPYEIGSGVKPPADWFKVQIGCAEKKAGFVPKSYKDYELYVQELNNQDTGYGIPKIDNFRFINFYEIPMIKQVVIPPVGEKVLEYYLFPEGDKYYVLGFTPTSTTATTTIDQILSTFRFD